MRLMSHIEARSLAYDPPDGGRGRKREKTLSPHKLRLEIEMLWEIDLCNCERGPGGMGVDHSPPAPRPPKDGREDAEGVMMPPGLLLLRIMPISGISGSKNSAGAHLIGCAGL